ncbi:DUF4173 domain-containing protein [Bifidobacterium sp. ESL0790]|uniref:DUF4153 domain-containing protein n=1 Tax=Bifidobacterium sp. ESL0790 TaxID=2983233 RepID=UPI0023F915A1|nr:DUF4173 domain-containing protein [Bifidobacterium sp. ESL0790]WEV73200.1 DUF4173 domain-containing protein [Bifidobacterium sp. ESL0790]
MPAFSQAVWIHALNACALAVTLPMTYLLVCGESDAELFRLRGLGHGIATFFIEQFRNWPTMGRVVSSLAHGHGKALGGAAAGAACGLGILVIVIPALSSADGNFASIMNHLYDLLLNINIGRRLLDIARFALIVPIAFSLLYALRHHRRKAKPVTGPATPSRSSVSAAALNTMLAILDVVYLVFVAIQFSYLFGGTDTLKRFGGYAAYARAGFFQLVAVTVINLVVVMACVYLRQSQKRSTPLLCLELVLVASTAVMLISAVWRMNLYVNEYGLTRLRLLTYWGMAAIAFLLVVTVVKLFRPRTGLFRLAVFGVVCLWLIFAFAQPDYIIAKVNVDGYLSGSIEQIDVDYLGELPAQASGPLNRLKNEASSKTVRKDAGHALDGINEKASHTDWSLWGI